MPVAEPPATTAAPYNPPQHLVANSSLTAAELVSQFDGFRESLCYVDNAPELVFERLVANLNEAFKQEQRQHAAAVEECCGENKVLQSSVDQLRLELAELKATVQEGRSGVTQGSSASSGSSTLLVPTGREENSAPRETSASAHLKFKFTATAKQVNVIATTSNNPAIDVAGCTWADVGLSDPDFRHGCYETLADYPGILPAETKKTTNFTSAFSSPPTVVVWFTRLAMDRNAPLSIKCSATNVTKTGFILRIATGTTSNLKSVGIAWVAYSNDTGVRSGSLSTRNPNAWKYPQFEEESVYFFDDWMTERVLVAVSELTLDMGQDVWVNVVVTGQGYSGKSLEWKMTAGPKDDARVYEVGVSYISVGREHNGIVDGW